MLNITEQNKQELSNLTIEQKEHILKESENVDVILYLLKDSIYDKYVYFTLLMIYSKSSYIEIAELAFDLGKKLFDKHTIIDLCTNKYDLISDKISNIAFEYILSYKLFESFRLDEFELMLFVIKGKTDYIKSKSFELGLPFFQCSNFLYICKFDQSNLNFAERSFDLGYKDFTKKDIKEIYQMSKKDSFKKKIEEINILSYEELNYDDLDSECLKKYM